MGVLRWDGRGGGIAAEARVWNGLLCSFASVVRGAKLETTVLDAVRQGPYDRSAGFGYMRDGGPLDDLFAGRQIYHAGKFHELANSFFHEEIWKDVASKHRLCPHHTGLSRCDVSRVLTGRNRTAPVQSPTLEARRFAFHAFQSGTLYDDSGILFIFFQCTG